MSDEELVKHARTMSGMLIMGEPVSFGSDAGMIDALADAIERLTRERDEAREQLRLANIDCFNAEAESKEMRDVAVEMRDNATAFAFRAEAAERKVEKLREALSFVGNIAHAEGDTGGICDIVTAALAETEKGDE